jgi:hypothetical protein
LSVNPDQRPVPYAGQGHGFNGQVPNPDFVLRIKLRGTELDFSYESPGGLSAQQVTMLLRRAADHIEEEGMRRSIESRAGVPAFRFKARRLGV